ncbi:MAG: hypothetical protein KDJ14_02285 [Xanthomonadales bacterium]|nr:hypothetical protein [Xanthomonadales bacterium]
MSLVRTTTIAGLAVLALTVGAALCGDRVLAGPKGPTPLDFTPDGTQPGLNVPVDEPAACSSCHGSSSTPDVTFIPHATWSGSMMANATRDPLFWAALDVANHDMPGVGDYCLRCHTPSGWLAGRVHKTGESGMPFINGQNGCALAGDLVSDDQFNNDFAGITCHLCHRTDERGPANEPTFIGNGNLWIDDSGSCETPEGSYFGPCRKGPYTYPMSSAVPPPPHGWKQDHFIGDSRFCGSCHDVSTPTTNEGPVRTLILGDGTDTGIPFPIERTFSEWQASVFGLPIFSDGFGSTAPETRALPRGQTCQSCHMRSSSDPDARACNFETPGSRTNDLPVHEFVGGNAWIPAVLRDEYGLGRTSAFNRTIAWTEEMLAERSADIDVQVLSVQPLPGDMQVRVRVTNKSGHKLPTGYSEGRRMWLNLRVTDNNGGTVFESGAYDASTGVLTEDPQIKVYEIIQGIWDRNSLKTCDADDGAGRKLFHFVLNNCVVKDNRIPPEGFTGGADLELRPVGYSYPEASPGVLAHWDDTDYTIPVAGGTALPLTVTATLRFQVSSKDYIEFLRDEAVNHSIPSENVMCGRDLDFGPADQSRGAFMHQLWQASGRAAPFDMVSDSAVATP